jgi:PAS domain S-box-containing protein
MPKISDSVIFNPADGAAYGKNPLKGTLKIVAWLAGAVLLVALGVTGSFFAFSQMREAADSRGHANTVLKSAGDLLSALKDAETGQRGYLLTGDETFLEPYVFVRDNISGQQEKLRQITSIGAARKHLDAMNPLIDAKLAELAHVIELYRNHDMTAAVALVRSGQGKLLMDSIRAEMRSFIQIEEDSEAQSDAAFQLTMRHLFTIIVIASLLTLLFALSFAYLIYRETQQRLKNLAHLQTQHLLEVQEKSNKQLQQTNASLQVSEEKLAVTLHSIGDAVLATDADGRVTLLNPLAERLTGWTQTQASGRPVEEVFHIINEETRQTCVIPVGEALAHGTVQTLANHTVLIARDGSECAIADSCAPIRDRDEQVVGAVLVFRDVTEIKRFERSLQEKNIELEHASRMKSEFLATMSHELRTPLNAIIGFSEALKDGLIGKMSDTQNEYIGDIFTSGQHLLSLINDVLDLSKVEAGMMALELEPVDLNSLLSNSLKIVKEKAAAQRISLELEAGADLGVPQLDLRKTKQIVYNLLSNAVKFSANGGRVTLRARRVSRSSVGKLSGAWPVHGFPLADSEYKEFLEICVIDSGIGISRENMEKLFVPFSQIDSSLARKFEGTGLGLAMVKQMAELHGGTVAVASAAGEGSCFAAWLPLRVPAEAATTLFHGTAAATVAAAEPKERIALVVEDDDQAADLIRLLLEAEGFSVLRAASAEAALLLAPQQTLSLITLDIQLPGIDGWEFLQRIREDSTLAHVPVVIIAGIADSKLALTRGAAAVLQKPISRAQLKSSLANLGLHPAQEHTHTVLVVDDDPKAVEVIAAFLPAPAYAVIRAYGGSEAIILAQRLRPDLILLDLMMPDVSGFDVVAALQRNTDTARIPILVVTAKQITASDRAALNVNPGKVIHIVEKAGFNNARFIAEVRRALLPN